MAVVVAVSVHDLVDMVSVHEGPKAVVVCIKVEVAKGSCGSIIARVGKWCLAVAAVRPAGLVR